MRKSISLVAVGLLAGCVSTSGTSDVRTMTYAEAAAFESDLLASPAPPVTQPAKLFTQPVNKNEPCKIPTSQDQIDRKNFRAYWDGDCKNGYAYGLGRDIAISDTHHVEEITIRGGSEDDYARQPRVSYDFVNGKVEYHVRGERYPATSGLNQFIRYDSGGFTASNGLVLIDEDFNAYSLDTSPLSPRKFYQNLYQRNVDLRLYDFADEPTASNQPIRVISILDPKTQVAGGVRIVQFRNGAVEHQKLGVGGQVVERANIPQEYVNHLLSKVEKVQEAISVANSSAKKAQQMEREYLYMACNGRHGIEGLDNATATKICSWRDQFKEPYEKAQANYQQQLEQRRQQAAAQEQQLEQRRMNQQLLAQQQAIANQQAWQSINSTLQNTANQINQQTLQIMNFQAPQVQPIAPPGGNQITCINSGVVTSCQY